MRDGAGERSAIDSLRPGAKTLSMSLSAFGLADIPSLGVL